jgi:hypothetical protein
MKLCGKLYIEANESLGKKDFLMRVKIYCKESKESAYWLKLVEINDQDRERIAHCGGNRAFEDFRLDNRESKIVLIFEIWICLRFSA